VSTIDVDRMNKIWAEIHFRVDTIQRLFPGARVRTCSGGLTWDSGQPSYVLVVLPIPKEEMARGECHNVVFDHELTKLHHMLDRVMKEAVEEATARMPIDPESIPIKMRQMATAFAALATSEETWTDEVKRLWNRDR
jgi:hypothetical protein